jgi:hypothetical protein
VFGFPAPGDPRWDEQTLAGTQTRYPRADVGPPATSVGLRFQRSWFVEPLCVRELGLVLVLEGHP